MKNHEYFMTKCIELAKIGNGDVSPNPMVGSIIVFDNKIIGSGYHKSYGHDHAEVNAINNVKDKKLLIVPNIFRTINERYLHAISNSCYARAYLEKTIVHGCRYSA